VEHSRIWKNPSLPDCIKVRGYPCFLNDVLLSRRNLHGQVADSQNRSCCGGSDSLENDRDGKPTIFGSIDMTAVLLGTGKSKRDSWFYFMRRFQLLQTWVRASYGDSL
jgi:hypothetical protein